MGLQMGLPIGLLADPNPEMTLTLHVMGFEQVFRLGGLHHRHECLDEIHHRQE